MKSLLLILFSLAMFTNTFSQDLKREKTSEITTYYFIRHAEKDRSDSKEENPHLNKEGLKRAEHWKYILENVNFDAVYATDYFRTKETGHPIADQHQLKITVYKPQDQTVIDSILKSTKGKTVLIVGHSNTIPEFVNTVIKKKVYDDIDDGNNGNLYIVTIINGTSAHQVLTIN